MGILSYIKNVIDAEAAAIQALSGQIDSNFEEAVDTILHCNGKVIVTGVGKSGHIGKKIAASLASTGTPAFFVHASEGVHGDLGMIEKEDVVIMISNSGETTELLALLPSLKIIGCKKITITSKNQSTLAINCDITLSYQYPGEADPLGLAPTTSSTVTLVIGDALAVTLSILKGFKKENFHVFHPGGSLGQHLANHPKTS